MRKIFPTTVVITLLASLFFSTPSFATSHVKPSPKASSVIKPLSTLATVETDAEMLGSEISTIATDYRSFGSKSGSISLNKGILVFSPMKNAETTSGMTTSGPGNTWSLVHLSPGSTLLSANYGAGKLKVSFGGPWCLVIANHLTYAKYTNETLQKSQIGGAPLKCVNGK